MDTESFLISRIWDLPGLVVVSGALVLAIARSKELGSIAFLVIAGAGLQLFARLFSIGMGYWWTVQQPLVNSPVEGRLQSALMMSSASIVIQIVGLAGLVLLFVAIFDRRATTGRAT